MAYIGKTPVIGNFVKLDAITAVNGQAAYTMQNGGSNFTDYESVNQFLVSLNGTIQAPTDSFTVSGSTLTFASNLSTGDVIDFVMCFGNSLSAGTPTDATVSTAKIVDDAVTAAKINNDIISGSTELATEPADTDEFLVSDAGTIKRIDYSLIKGGGLTMADQWRLTASITGTNADITANLEQVDTVGQGTLGSAMSVSSGVFTFPSTGIYLVLANPWFSNGTDSDAQSALSILVTTNNSSYSTFATAAAANKSGSAVNFTSPTSTLIDVTDTSNVKVKFATVSLAGTSSVFGDTSNINYTHFTFLRLGDT